jgi:polysaccharide biosynthesis/export protein
MRPARLALLLLFVPAIAGCASSAGRGLASRSAPPPTPVVANVDTLVYERALPVAQVQAYSPAYALDSGDRLRVVVFGQEGLTNSYAVDTAGNITLPLIGPVRARGHTTTEVSAALVERLRDGFLREPHVAVEVEAYRPFFILGEVTFPGQYPYVANMTVETAVAIAGGFSPRAFRRTVDVSRPVKGLVVRETVPIATPIRPGDTVVVSERWF